jgi:hypothetical protein
MTLPFTGGGGLKHVTTISVVVVIEGGAFVGEDVVVVTGSDWLR